MQMSLGEVATVLGTSCSTPDKVAQGYSIDSRTVRPGDLFFAIRGPKFDGHDFVASAIERGAAGAVVEKQFSHHVPRGRAPLLPVENPLEGLQRLAQAVRKRWAQPLVGITGSAGKTTTKEIVATILAKRYAVHKSAGNLNNDFGLPLTLLQLEPFHQVAVVELAMSGPGEIARLTHLAAPIVGVVTNVAPVHLQFFDSIDGIAGAKRELIENLEAGAAAVLNFDDPRVRRFQEGFGGRVLSFGFEPGSMFRAVELRTPRPAEMEFRVKGDGLDEEIRLPLPGRHNVLNALAAIAVASHFEIPPAVIRDALEHYHTLNQRSEILSLGDGITVLNDSYNSNPLAMEKMLEAMAAWPDVRRRIVVAGEMLELGPTSPELHKEIGRKCVDSGVEWLLAVQGDARFFLEGAWERGLPRERGQFFNTGSEAAEYGAKILRSGDLVLVKGSRGVHLEQVIELLRTRVGVSPVETEGSLRG